MEEVGELKSRKISENEFSYNWHFCKRGPFFSCRSPIFGTLCSSFSDCYLLFRLDVFFNNCVIIFYFDDCYVPSKVSSVSLKIFTSNGQSYPLTSLRIVDECGFTSRTKICEFHLTYELYSTSENFLFTLQLKLPKALTAPVNEESRNKPYVDNPNELIQDLRSIYTSGEMCDLEIRIGENILRAHKFMLCSRSPVFKKMLEHDCLESSSNSITITDCSEIPFKKFLMYLYTGEIEDLSMDTVVPLYSLGDKYDVPALQYACSDILQNKLSESVDDVANIVCDVLQLAELHNDIKLKDLAVSFIVKHFSVVSNTQGWRYLMKNDFTCKFLALVVAARQKLRT
ncbi:TD and POZ domain-containing protein 2 [Parasteatoda tepidariorum]|uniref:TD and POZ domain-containing protein 2 n=1 Tax=Parasteatoda tepidariorum TaxID=114398 RepID=UPI001C7240D6|nr:TD and POZ domain-containing protein 2-like [Parasteatoda tepidariorum]